MKCDDVDNFVIFILVLFIITDVLALFAKLLDRKCKDRAEQERQQKEEKINHELADLRKRVIQIEKKLECN